MLNVKKKGGGTGNAAEEQNFHLSSVEAPALELGVVLHEFKVGLSYIYKVPFSIIIIIIHKFSKCQLQKSAVKIQSLNLEIRLERTKPLTKAKLCSCKKSQS